MTESLKVLDSANVNVNKSVVVGTSTKDLSTDKAISSVAAFVESLKIL